MDMLSLDDLLSGLEAAQHKKSTVRLSERNVVELVIKLKQLGFLGDELLHTVNGREYITRDRLREEVAQAVDAAGGRLPLADLPSALGVDLAHCELAAHEIVDTSKGDMIQAQGELFAVRYFDNLAVDVDQNLHESGVVVIGDLARKFGIGVDMLQGALNSRMGRSVHGRLEGGVIYTDAYLSRVKAQLRGALRAALAPVTLTSLRKDLGLENLGALSACVPSLVDELQRSGSIRGKATAGSWVPASYAHAQQDAVRTFFQQNMYVEYDMASKHGVSNPTQYMKTAFPDGIALSSTFVAAGIISQVDAAVEEAIASGGWCDISESIPSALDATDAAQLLEKCKAAQASGVHVVAETCVVSETFVEGIRTVLKKEAATAAQAAHKTKKAADAAKKAESTKNGGAVETGMPSGGKKGGGGAGTAAALMNIGDSSDDDWDMGKGGGKGGKKGKGGGKKGKSTGGSTKTPPAAASTRHQGGGKGTAGDTSAPPAAAACLSQEALLGRIVALHPDVEGLGVDGELAAGLVALVRPAVVAEYERALADIFTAGAERRRRLREAASARLSSSFDTFQVQSHGTELFASDESTLAVLQRHLVRTAGPLCVDALLHFLAADAAEESQKIRNDPSSSEQSQENVPEEEVVAVPFSVAARTAAVREAPPDAKKEVAGVVDALGAASTTPEEFIAAMESAASAFGLRLKHLEKKREAAAVETAAVGLKTQAQEAADAPTLLAAVVPYLLAKHMKKSVSVPGKVLGAAVELLKESLGEENHKVLAEFHAEVVEYLKGGGGGGSEKLEALGSRVRTMLE